MSLKKFTADFGGSKFSEEFGVNVDGWVSLNKEYSLTFRDSVDIPELNQPFSITAKVDDQQVAEATEWEDVPFEMTIVAEHCADGQRIEFFVNGDLVATGEVVDGLFIWKEV